MAQTELQREIAALKKEFAEHAKLSNQHDNAGTYMEWLERQLIPTRATLLAVQHAIERLERAAVGR